MLFDFLGLYPYYGHKILTWFRVGYCVHAEKGSCTSGSGPKRLCRNMLVLKNRAGGVKRPDYAS